RKQHYSLMCLYYYYSEAMNVIGLIGHNITLPCGFCWGQGQLPVSKCSNTILSSYGTAAVDFRQSSRYQLLGRVTDGDISLTILNAQQSDAGVYGCRVEIPGVTMRNYITFCNIYFSMYLENIARIGAIFFCSIIIILVLYFP
uniref:Immunoglobulin V-set domain-containing protein n=1 Tax=Lates calcarifer TaxID=8187 RepID=A0A4W6E9Y7_LATCA